MNNVSYYKIKDIKNTQNREFHATITSEKVAYDKLQLQ